MQRTTATSVRSLSSRTSFEDALHLRVKLGLSDLLIERFSQPRAVLERKIIQSPAFRRDVLTKWANYCVTHKRVFAGDELKSLMTLCPVKSTEPEISWMLERISDPRALQDAATTAFPSTLARTGPQFPFSPQEFDHLSRKFGSITGAEMTRPVPVERNTRGISRRANISRAQDYAKYRWTLADDEDNFEEDLLNPKSVSLFPSF